jgi:hypothetical protein
MDKDRKPSNCERISLLDTKISLQEITYRPTHVPQFTIIESMYGKPLKRIVQETQNFRIEFTASYREIV